MIVKRTLEFTPLRQSSRAETASDRSAASSGGCEDGFSWDLNRTQQQRRPHSVVLMLRAVLEHHTLHPAHLTDATLHTHISDPPTPHTHNTSHPPPHTHHTSHPPHLTSTTPHTHHTSHTPHLTHTTPHIHHTSHPPHLIPTTPHTCRTAHLTPTPPHPHPTSNPPHLTPTTPHTHHTSHLQDGAAAVTLSPTRRTTPLYMWPHNQPFAPHRSIYMRSRPALRPLRHKTDNHTGADYVRYGYSISYTTVVSGVGGNSTLCGSVKFTVDSSCVVAYP